MNQLSAIKKVNTIQKELEEVKAKEYKEKNIRNKISDISDITSELLIHKKLIAPIHRNSMYDREKVIANNRITFDNNGESKSIINFNAYDQVLNQILTDLKYGILPEQSYIIGAPNGFGKTSFVVTAMKYMQVQRMNICPYISLSELAELKIEKEKELCDGLRLVRKKAVEDGKGTRDVTRFSDFTEYNNYIELEETVKRPITITGCYSWSEYLNSSLLFCFFTEVSSKVVESYILKSIVKTRATKGLATIVFLDTSLKPYTNDATLDEQVWADLLMNDSIDNTIPRLDRLKHISCFRRKL